MLSALVSQTVVALPDTIKTRPRYLGWHRRLIISLVVVVIDCVERFTEINKYKCRDFIIIHFKQNFVRDSDKSRFSGMTRTEG